MRGYPLGIFAILVFALMGGAQTALACDHGCQSFNSIKGRWWAGDFEFADMGRCAVEESVDLILSITALEDTRVTGTYTERLRRAPAYRDCGGSRGYEFVYALTFDMPMNNDQRPMRAALKLTQCRPANWAQCDAAASRRAANIVLPTGSASLIFDGIAFTKAD